MTTKTVGKGTQFRHVYADSNALWEVFEQAGPGVWRAVIVDEPVKINGKIYPGDYAGVVDVFDEERILAQFRMEEMWSELNARRGDFFETLEIGQVVHYHDAFGRFVRCEVVRSEDDSENQLQPIALVGEWRPYDLPQRMHNGEITLPYHAKKVLNRTGAWQPSDGCVYESPNFADQSSKGIDPTKLEPIDLHVPAPSPKELATIRKVQLLEEIGSVIDYRAPEASLAAIRRLLR